MLKYLIGALFLFQVSCASIDKIYSCKTECLNKKKELYKDTYCRIGMTHKLENRLGKWIRDYKKKNHTVIKYEIIGLFESKQDAQKLETKEVKAQSCEGHPGGDGPEKAKWFVYKLTIKNLSEAATIPKN